MIRKRIYIDTSVIGGYYDVEFKTATRYFFKRIADKDFDVFFSEVNETELINAPQRCKGCEKFHSFRLFSLHKCN